MLLKGTLSDPPSKDDNVRFTTIPLKRLFLCASKGEHLNCNLINFVEDTIVYLTQKLFFFSVNISIVPYKEKSYICRETANENKQFKQTKKWISNLYLIRQSIQGRLPL